MFVKKADDIPKGPHWAIASFKQVTRSEPGYDKDDPPDTYTTIETSLEVFEKEEDWRAEIAKKLLTNNAYRTKDDMVAYHVDKVAKATLTPVVEIN